MKISKKMKKVLFFALLLMILGAASVNAQVRIGGNGEPHTAAVLDLNASDETNDGIRGLALPRVSLAGETDLLNGVEPLDGMLVYNTNGDDNLETGLYYWKSKWTKLGGNSNGLNDAGNGLTITSNTVELGGTLTKATEIAQAGFNLYTIGTGKVSIGIAPTANSAKFEVSGAAANTEAFSAGSSQTIDFSQSNLAYTSASAGAFTLNNLKDGGAYTLAVQGTTSGTSTFTATNTANDNLTVKILNSMATVTGKHTLYTILVMGTTAYVFVNTGF
jgi:hypothetical protein